MKDELIVEMKHITKNFGGLRALDDVHLELYGGIVTGLVGDNGAGKSTLIKILTGVYSPDRGEIYFKGKKINLATYHCHIAKDLGIQAAYQNLALVDDLHTPGNVFLGQELKKTFLGNFLKVLDNPAMLRESRTLLKEKLEIELSDYKQPVFYLSGGQRQAIAIARSIWAKKLHALILDEPTASMGPEETEKIIDLIRTLKSQGIALIVISHNLEHVFSVSDRIMVLRRGKLVGVREISETDKTDILGLIIGAKTE